ncbi:MAG: hypothetical protein HY898_18410 [Deltaproteobacteria bacterium]|nr:hypothetical protein [Deltaproteobacteria bacterium]
MRRTSSLYLLACLTVPAAIWIGCSGSDGAPGAPGANGSVGPAGSAGPAGSSATANPSISAIVPSSAFLGRTIDVVIAGNGTTFDAKTDKTTVKFGDDVTVNNVTVASPTALLVNITVGNTKVGPLDVTVGTLTYKQAFTTKPSTTLKVQGKAAQGSIAILTGQQLDFTTPYDTTSTGDGFFTPLEFTNIQVSSVPGVAFQISNVASYGIDLIALFDVQAAAGAKDLDILSGPAGGTQIHNPIPGGMTIEARTATDLVSGTPATATVENAFDSYLYKFTPAAGFQVIELDAKAAGTGATPGFVLMPGSGQFADMISPAIAASRILKTDKADPYYLVFWDNSGTFGYDFTLNAVSTVPTKVTEVTTDNETSGNAQAVAAMPFLIEAGEFKAPTSAMTAEDDVDWYKFTATGADVGKKVRVRTFAGTAADAQTDTVVEVFGSDGTTSMGGESSDADYHENFTSTAIAAAGDIYVKISASHAGYFSASATKFDALVSLK